MIRMTFTLLLLLHMLPAFLIVFISSEAIADEIEGNRYAIFVGVNEYEHPSLPSSKYAVSDVTEAASILREHGWICTVLSDKTGNEHPALAPTLSNIEDNLRRISRQATENDVILFAFSGHGIKFAGRNDAFLIPREGKPFQDTTYRLLSLSAVVDELDKSFAKSKMLLIDASRNEPLAGRGLEKGFTVSMPNGIVALLSCSPGERALEHDELGHGVFFYSVIIGLRGLACNDAGEVTFLTLAEYVQREVPSQVAELFSVPSLKQNPHLLVNLSRSSPVLVDCRKDLSRSGKDRHEPNISTQN